MYELRDKTKENIRKSIERDLGISYEEYMELTLEEQQALRNKKRKREKIELGTGIVRHGSGENSIFVRYHKGDKVFDGNKFIEAGLTEEEHVERISIREQAILKEKPKGIVKQLVKRSKDGRQ